MNRGTEKWALCFGSIIGAGQMAIGLPMNAAHGMLAAFVASTALYIVATKLYLWATETKDGDEDDKQK